MSKKVILSADSTCDIGKELQEKFDIQFFHFHILIGEKSFIDGVDINPDDMYKAWRQDGILPKTAAIAPAEYYKFFEKWVKEGYEVVHINLGSGISAAHQNCCIAAEEIGNVYPVDSASLSTGFGHLVVRAGEMVQQGLSAVQIQRNLLELRPKTRASFVLDTLEFMRAGGRCSAVAAFGANILKLKPCIRVDNAKGGKMDVGKKYRGDMEKVLKEYIKDQLENENNLNLSRIFITHSGSPDSDIELAKNEIKKYANFEEIHVTRASGTISAHCGPRTLGILFMVQ